jgi:uncharacterized protein (TIGR02391 family)
MMNLETEISRELWQAVRRSYESQLWSNAILDSIHYMSDALRTKTGLQSDGVALVGQALGGKAPKLRLSRLQTDSEKNVQAGVEQLLRGLYQGIRNPRSHERIDDSQADAEVLILFVDYLLRVIGHARTAFSIDECVGQIVEENFVPTKRYADLLVEGIPPRQRLQVALAVYQRKGEAESTKLRYFFSALIERLSADDAQALFDAISIELRETSEEGVLRSVLQLLHPDYWPRLDEVARLRTENRLIRNVQEGRYVPNTDKCLGGALATWSTSFWQHFSMKRELFRAIMEKLESMSRESQDYAFHFCFMHLDSLTETPPAGFQRIVAEGLKVGDSRFKEALDNSILWEGRLWSERVQKAIAEFQPAEEVPEPDDFVDDDLPF